MHKEEREMKRDTLLWRREESHVGRLARPGEARLWRCWAAVLGALSLEVWGTPQQLGTQRGTYKVVTDDTGFHHLSGRIEIRARIPAAILCRRSHTKPVYYNFCFLAREVFEHHVNKFYAI